MAGPQPVNPRVARLQQLEAEGRIKPEHQAELDRYRALGVATDPKLTELQAKGGAFLTRATGANREYESTGVGPRSLLGQIVSEYAPNLLNSLPEPIGNSAPRQRADSAQDEFVAASLRMDSGAAIPEPELENQKRIYFPMPGDGPEVIEQKRRARQRAIEGLKVSAGPVARRAQQTGERLSPAKSSGWSIQKVPD